MCGICGYVYLNPRRPAPAGELAPMVEALAHRGPDERGSHVERNAALGHTRLTIIDLKSGTQPLSNEDASVWITYNGEVYNFPDLREKLLSLGHVFSTNTDTEVIVHLYEEYGIDCLKYLRGMFAFCLWDKKNDLLFLVRDRVGIKPVHYYLDSEKIVFASEIKSILRFPGLDRELSLKGMDYFFTYLYIPGAETIFEKIKKVRPGHFLLVQNGKVMEKQYWRFEPKPEKHRPIRQIVQDVTELLTEAIRIRLISDVPLGAFLSGGIDSSTVVALMSRSVNAVRTFSIGFADQRFNELHHAKTVADLYRTDHREFTVTPDIEEIVTKIIPCFDEPFGDASAIPTYYVSKMARTQVKTILSGDGGDETHLGYRQYWSAKLSGIFDSIPVSLREKFILKFVRAFLPSPRHGVNLLSRIRFFWERNLASPEIQFLLSRQIFSDDLKRELFNKDIAAGIAAHDPLDYVRDCFRGGDLLEGNALADFKMYLPDDILTKVDRMSMANSLEVRVPLLDHVLLEYLMTVPWKTKLPGYSLRNTKFILKEIAKKLLPSDIVYRPKQGFAVPVRGWLHGELKELVMDCLSEETIRGRGLFDYDCVRKILPGARKLQDFRFDTCYDTWALLVFELWYRNHMIHG